MIADSSSHLSFAKEKKNLQPRASDISVQWHTDARVATLIIVSGWDWYGLAGENATSCPSLHLEQWGSHELLQGDASSDFKERNFIIVSPCLFNATATFRQTAKNKRSFPYQTSGSGPSCAAALREKQAVAASAATPGNVGLAVILDIGLFWSRTPGTVHGHFTKHRSRATTLARVPSLMSFCDPSSLTRVTFRAVLFSPSPAKSWSR